MTSTPVLEYQSTALESRPGGTPLGYMPQLDGLRAIAVVGVWFEHWGIYSHPGFRWVEWGRLAIWLFFVLSGFLITGILLQCKAAVDMGHHSVGREAFVFYARRFLRILPIYYITLFAMAILLPDVRRLFFWHVTYTTDFWVTRHPGSYPPGVHFWTLAVEEQFYLIWPMVVLLLPRAALVRILLFMTGAALVYRAAFYGLRVSQTSVAALPLPFMGNLDKFAVGGLLATFRVDPTPAGAIAERSLRRIGLWIALPLLIGFEILRVKVYHLHDSRPALAFTSTVAAGFFAWVIAAASIGFRGPIGAFLQSRPIVFGGKISYGIYLFHMFIPRLLGLAHVPLPQGLWPRFFIYAGVTVLLAIVSWYLIEAPINSLKRYFRYDGSEKRDRERKTGQECSVSTPSKRS